MTAGPPTVPGVFEPGLLAIGLVAAFIVGISKTGIPGGALIAIPLFATVFDGRLIAGGTLPVLLVADAFAIAWYREHADWAILRSLAPWIGAGYVLGAAFFIAVGSATGTLEITIGVIVLAIVGLQLARMLRPGAPAGRVSTWTAATHGTTGGFTTFVANAAGPVINTFLIRSEVRKHVMIGTSAWLYFVINITKIPIYAALGAWATGGPFFTAESLRFDAALVPATIAGVYAGRLVFRLIPQRWFNIVVVTLSAAGAVRLLLA